MSHIIIIISIPRSGFMRCLNSLRFLQNTVDYFPKAIFKSMFIINNKKKGTHFTIPPSQ